MVKVGGESYVFSSIDRLEEWIEKFVKVAANHDKMLGYFKAKMDRPKPIPTALVDGFFRDGFRSMAYPDIFQGLDIRLQDSLKIMLSNALSVELDLGNALYPYSLEGIIPMDLPRSRPNFDHHTDEQAYLFKSTHELQTYLQAGVDVVVADDRMSKYYISRVEQTKPINVRFWRDVYRNVKLSHPTISEMQNNSRIHLLRALKCKLNHALKLEDKSISYSLEYLVAPNTPTGRSIDLPSFEADIDKARYTYPTPSEFFTTKPSPFEQPKLETIPMHIERPINVIGTRGCINILTATVETLAKLIREAQEEIEVNKDLALISKAYAKKAVELEKIIELCVKQLDKVAK